MKCLRYNSTVCIVLVFVFFTGFLCSAAEKNIESPDGYLLIEENTWQKLMVGEGPAYKFKKAQENFLNNNLQDAALNIRQAATIVNIEITRAQKEMHKDLQSLAEELITISKRVKDGKVSDTKQLERLFYKTEKLLASHKLKKAGRYLSLGIFLNSAYALEATVRHILDSQIWAEIKLSDNNIMKLKEIHTTMLTMIDTETYAKKKLDVFKKDLDELIAHL